ncbi:MAG: DTW domain-containing protein [Helicobacteraceae bacterium]|nr:DTW domain-containing protein [Helicobacteraceae bacterium]
MCSYIQSLDTKTKFVVLMHPKEFKKVKNNTGHFTHQSLPNSELFIGVDFSEHQRINEIIEEYQSFILFPSKEALNLTSQDPKELFIKEKKQAIFVIDSTWACTKKMFDESVNLQLLPHISFETKRTSEYSIKEQPQENYLSTIESVHEILSLLDAWDVEVFEKGSLKGFLEPFYQMIAYQQKLIQNPQSNAVRFKKRSNFIC